MLIFISGGVRSGKSSFAEKLAMELSREAGQLHYIATSERYDDEMIARIKKHQEDRAKSSHNWQTWEQPVKLHQLLDAFTSKDVVLIDCLTTLLGNELFSEDCWLDERAVNQLSDRLKSTFAAYKLKTKATIVVSNEIFSGGIPVDEGSRLYMKELGKMHQYLTAIANQAYLLECGLARLMKEGP
ncbi:MAG TPA: bifunctional adenosylcobinamide kinase/adenosylcobinamide-phosphate guanylyltransferase [Bacillus bacterium]|nr:bifunctional adenosylcobinamide kinase/adenosylcobinamide-phosphate guanylyltransferase [Bacillus sp. (in: firmicutes)]